MVKAKDSGPSGNVVNNIFLSIIIFINILIGKDSGLSNIKNNSN